MQIFTKNDKNILTNDKNDVIKMLKIKFFQRRIIMWTKSKSFALTHFMVRSFYFVWVATAVGLPFYINLEFNLTEHLEPLLPPIYIALPIGMVALVCLDKLLINIKKETVFDMKNVKLLRILSWCCIIASIISLVAFVVFVIKGFYFDGLMFVVFVLELFVGIIVRVIKNLFESAIELKEENDLTV